MSFRPSSWQVPPPKDWQDFERNLRELLEAEWKCRVEMHGRTGQPQHGVDIYGQPDGNGYHGVQCKGKDALLGSEVSKTELLAEVEKAREFEPRIAQFTLATTGPRDAKIQLEARKFNKRKGKPFPVELMFWEDVLALYDKHEDVFRRHYDFLIPMLERLHQLRPPLRDFTGRTEELDDLLVHIDQGVTISGVQGMGGVGKTELAYVLAERIKERCPDAQLYLDLKGTSEQPLSPADVLAFVIRCFHPEAKLPDDLKQLQGLYHSTLNGKRVLLLMDNAGGPDHEAAAGQIRPLCPPPAGCVLLVTSRQRFALPDLYAKNIDALSEADAVKLLRTICDRIGDHATEIARLCGRLPLALRAAASLLGVRPDIAPDEYVAALADERTRLERIGKEGAEIEVDASFGLSYQKLPEAAARVFRLLSVFPATFDAAAEERVCEDANHAQLGELLRHSLVEFDATTKRYRLHDLVRVFAKRRLDEAEHAAERPPAEQRFAEHYCAVLAAANRSYKKGETQTLAGLALADLEWTNILEGARWARWNAECQPAALRLATAYPDTGTYVLALRLHPRQRIEWLEAGIGASRWLNDYAAEARHLGNLGIAHDNLGYPHRAIEYYEQVLEIGRAIGDRHIEGSALGNLAIVHRQLGQPRRAIEFYEQVLQMTRAIGDRRGEGVTFGNLGNAYVDLGEPRRAVEYHDQALSITREIGDPRGEGRDLGNLGRAHAALGEPRRAIEFFERSVKLARTIGDRRGEATALGNLGVMHRQLGEPQRAIEFCEKQLEIARQIGDRVGEAYASWNLGKQHAEVGNLARAVELMQVLVDYRREIGHPDAEKHAAYVAALRARVDAGARAGKVGGRKKAGGAGDKKVEKRKGKVERKGKKRR